MTEYIIIGRIINVNYNYSRIVIQSKHKKYLIEYSQYKMNKFGYIPKVSHWIEVEGKLFSSDDDLMDGVIKNLKSLTHLDL